MKNKIIIGSVVFVALFVYFVHLNDIKMKQQSDLTELKTEHEQLTIEMLQHIKVLKENFNLQTSLYNPIKKDSMILANLIDKGARIGLFIDRFQCEDCWMRAVAFLKKETKNNHLLKPFILASSYNQRNFFLLNQRYKMPFPVYLLDRPEEITFLLNENQPFYFVLNQDGTMNYIFYPEGLYEQIGEFYLKSVTQYCFQNAKFPQNHYKSPIALLNPSVDLGKISIRQKKEIIFNIKNTGTNKCSIKNVHPSCNCILLESAPDYILPQQTGKIKVAFLSVVKGQIEREMQFSIDQSQTVYHLKIKANVI